MVKKYSKFSSGNFSDPSFCPEVVGRLSRLFFIECVYNGLSFVEGIVLLQSVPYQWFHCIGINIHRVSLISGSTV